MSTPGNLRARARHLGRAVAAITVLVSTLAVAVGAGVTLVAAPAAAAPGDPGVPGAPTVIFVEDFENGLDATTVSLSAYTGAGGRTYSADPYWLDLAGCNGVLVRYATPTFDTGHCTDGGDGGISARRNVRRMADVLGQVQAGAPGGTLLAPTNASTAGTRANHAVTAWTTEFPGPDNQAQFRTTNLGLRATGTRYYGIAVDIAEASCRYMGGVNNSRLNFWFEVDGTEVPVNDAPVRACTDPDVGEYTSPDLGGWDSGGFSIRAGRFHSDTSLLLSPDDLTGLAIVMRNEEGDDAGNDSAFDNLALVDTTPQLDKSFSPRTTRVGQTSTLTLTVTNRADLGAKADWSFTDTLPTGLLIAPTPVVGGTCGQHAGQPFTVSAPAGGRRIAVVGGDLDTGETSCTITVTVTAAAAGTYTNGPANFSDVEGLDLPADADVTFIAPSIELTKTPDRASYDTPGQIVTYTFVATNTGSDPLSGVSISDPMPGLSALSCRPGPPAGLDPGETVTCTATRTITQADVDAGSLPNTATVVATDLLGGTVRDTASALVRGARAAALTLTKDADRTSFDAAAQTITYTFVATNVGNVTLTGVSVSDPLPGLSRLSCTPGAPAVLAPGDDLTCTATYDATQADLDAGRVDNTATATGTAPGGGTVTDVDTATVPAAQASALALTKTPDVGSFSAPGTVITYTFVATNTGNTTLTGVSVDDPLPGLTPLSCTPGTPATLAPGAFTTCTASYEVTQADLDAGGVENTATATGTDPSGGTVTDDDTIDVPALRLPDIELDKVADVASFDAAGDVVTYTFTATNVGNVSLTGLAIADPLPGLSPLTCTPTAPTTLAPGDGMTCTATYETTQADMDAGLVTNGAAATGTDPSGGTVTDDDTIDVPALRLPDIELDKVADVASFDAAGDVVTYTFTATNVGNVSLTGLAIADPLPGLSPLTCTPTAPATLAPGDGMTCTATYETTQADMDAGLVTNGATATGTDPSGGTVTDDDTIDVPAVQTPAVELEKTADIGRATRVGDTVTYTLVATNTGTVTLTDLTVTDPLPGLGPLTCDPARPARVAPGERVTCTATYVVTQRDLDAGGVTNTATVHAEDPGGDPVTDTDSVVVTADPPGAGSTGSTRGPGGWLPHTGRDVTAASAFGIVALLAGVILVAAERRSRRAAD